MRIPYPYLLLSGALVLAGCGGGDSDPDEVGATAVPSDITVERGPLLHAVVTDAAGNRAMPIGNGVYRFDVAPVYPVATLGGYIDVDRNGVVDEGDVRAGDLMMRNGESGGAVTLASTLATNPELKARLLALGFTEVQLRDGTPSQDRMIAALSDEVYRFAVENGLGDVARMTLEQMYTLENAILARVRLYQLSTESVASLEQALMTELAASLDPVDEAEADAIAVADNMGRLFDSLPTADLSDELKGVLVYMWNEEKLAKDVYLALYDQFQLRQLETIANNSESQHQETMRALLEKYDLGLVDPDAGYSGAELAAVAPGAYTVPALQSLYDTLYGKGIASARDSLEVGCMVEVTDVDDLNRDLLLAADVPDVKTAFENLRAGSYNHYWAFDQGLRAMGVADGCCSLGTAYCHPEYPNAPGRR